MLRRAKRTLGMALALGVVAVVGSVSTAQAATDQAANTVRAVGGAPEYGPDSGLRLNANFVGIAALKSGGGYWAVASDGGVFARGDARFYGSTGGRKLNKPVVGMAAAPAGDGYWLVASDGGVFAFGHVGFYGSLGNKKLNAPIVALASTQSGKGYWMLGADGGVFAFGDAGFYGSLGNKKLNAPVVAIGPTPSSLGYYLLGADGGVFTFGNARFAGAAVDGKRATGITVIRAGAYQVARADGSVAGLGGEPSITATPDMGMNVHPVVGIAAHHGGRGSWLVRTFVPPPPSAPTVPDLSQDPFLRCTRAHESDSAGGYHAVSPGGVYRGAYQFLRSTWDNVARRLGRFDLVGVDPAAASPHDQDLLALALYHWQGPAPWGGRCAGLP
jgi:hypothetical protein